MSSHNELKPKITLFDWILDFVLRLGQDVKVVETPPFAESVSEGDVRWDKGKRTASIASVKLLVLCLMHVDNNKVIDFKCNTHRLVCYKMLSVFFTCGL